MRLTVLTANMWLLIPPFMKDNDYRVGELIKIIKTRKPDIVFLQEVWLKRYVQKIKKELPEYFLVASYMLRRSRMGRLNLINRSGLATLSRWPLISTSLTTFRRSKGSSLVERMAMKGMLGSDLAIKGKKVRLFNVHVYSCTNGTEEQIAINQIKSIQKKVVGNGLVIVGGDFDMPPDIVKKQIGDDFIFGLDSQKTVSSKNHYWQDPLHKIMNNEVVVSRADRKLDYVIVRAKESKRVKIKSEVIKEPLVSDHYPVWAEITIT